MNKLITVKELAERLDVSVPTIHRMVKDGLPVKRVSRKTLRFDYEEVIAFVSNKEEIPETAVHVVDKDGKSHLTNYHFEPGFKKNPDGSVEITEVSIVPNKK